MRWTPSNRTSVKLEAGYRYGKPNFTANIQYRRSEHLTIFADFTQGVETSQGALSDASQRAGRNALGVLVDPLTGLAPTAATTPFELTNQAFRYARARLGLRGTLGRTFYDASGSYERRTANGGPGDSWSAQATLGRHLTRHLTATLEGQYATSTNTALSLAPD